MSTATFARTRDGLPTRTWPRARPAAITCRPSAPPATCSAERRDTLRGVAPESLRRRCAAQRPHAAALAPPPLGAAVARRHAAPRCRAPSSSSALTQSVEALAAGLTLDHVKCFKVSPAVRRRSTPRKLRVSWQRSQGWPSEGRRHRADRRAAARRRAALPVVRGTRRTSDVSLARPAAVGLRASSRLRTRPHHGQHGARDGDLVRQRPHLRGARHRPSRTTSITSSATSRHTPSDNRTTS